MPTEIFTATCFIDVPPAELYTHLTEPQSYVGLSPLVVKVYDVSRGTDANDKALVRYTTVEHFRFLGFIPYNNPIHVTCTLERPGEILVNEVNAALGIQVRFKNEFRTENGGTLLTETVIIQCPSWVKGFVVGQAQSTQKIRLARLKARLESREKSA